MLVSLALTDPVVLAVLPGVGLDLALLVWPGAGRGERG